mgnify:FL=1
MFKKAFSVFFLCFLFVSLLAGATSHVKSKYMFIKELNATITAYSNDPISINVPKWRDGKTATGVIAKKGICAADWKKYPVGTIMYIPNYGICEVQDRGSAIKGKKKIDVFVDSYEEAIEWGVQKQPVYVLKITKGI